MRDRDQRVALMLMELEHWRGARIFETQEEYAAFAAQNPGPRFNAPRGRDRFSLLGWCGVCRRPAHFRVYYQFGGDKLNRRPNWREHLVCQSCGLNARLRASLQCILGLVDPGARIFLTEQTTPLYRQMTSRFSNVIGSEFLSDGTPSGRTNANGWRHEDMTRLSFGDNQFDAVATFECLEHIPEYRQALRECWRVLRRGGHLILTAPFVVSSKMTLIRARVEPDGSITHLVPPEYHGDPVNPEAGILCYYHFGWDLIEILKDTGFCSASVKVLASRLFGFTGGEVVIVATA